VPSPIEVPAMNRKNGKMRSRRRPTVPFGVEQGPIHGAPVAGIVDDHHSGGRSARGRHRAIAGASFLLLQTLQQFPSRLISSPYLAHRRRAAHRARVGKRRAPRRPGAPSRWRSGGRRGRGRGAVALSVFAGAARSLWPNSRAIARSSVGSMTMRF
jgi:hypothetical protein